MVKKTITKKYNDGDFQENANKLKTFTELRKFAQGDVIAVWVNWFWKRVDIKSNILVEYSTVCCLYRKYHQGCDTVYQLNGMLIDNV